MSTTTTTSNNYTITVPVGSGGTYYQEPVTIKTLFPGFDKWAIGFDSLLREFANVSGRSKVISYPPYNLYKNGDMHTIEIAVAGYTKKDIRITLDEGNLLTIEGDNLNINDLDTIYQGISARLFKQEFLLVAKAKVTSAELNEGLLRITIYAETERTGEVKNIKVT